MDRSSDGRFDVCSAAVMGLCCIVNDDDCRIYYFIR